MDLAEGIRDRIVSGGALLLEIGAGQSDRVREVLVAAGLIEAEDTTTTAAETTDEGGFNPWVWGVAIVIVIGSLVGLYFVFRRRA